MATENDELIVLMSAYDDWESAVELIGRLDDIFYANSLKARIVIVDDGSPFSVDTNLLANKSFSRIIDVTVVTLARNLGNQRAIAIGIGYISSKMKCSNLVVMDSDLEDRPEYVPDLIAAAETSGDKIIFAERTQRSEGFTFRLFYRIYKTLYKILTGMPISIGNFSVIPGKLVKRVAGISEIMNHFPAGIMRARIPFDMIGATRGERLYDKSKMNFVSLIIHGLSGFVVHADIVAVRTVLVVLTIGAIIIAAVPIVIFLRLFTDIFVLGWTSQMIVILGGILFQVFLAAMIIVFFVLTNKNQYQIIPRVDYDKYILESLLLEFNRAP